MKRNSRKKHMTIKNYALILCIALGAMIVLINDFGLIKLIALKKQKYQLTSQLTSLANQQNNLREKIYRLQHDQEYIEKIARERYMMVVPGEKVYRIASEKQVNSE